MRKKRVLTICSTMLLLAGLVACNAAGTGNGSYASIPAGKAYSEGQEIYFIHTESSDPEIAEKLTNMMKSPVLVVPALADVPDSALASVYVFANGLKGSGPLGFQVDVFDAPPSLPEKYSPLRRLITIKWNDNVVARELKSAAEILSAEDAGELTSNATGVVINMPFVTWSGGKR